MHIEYMFCFICSKQCIKIISSCKKCGLLSSERQLIAKLTLPHGKIIRVIFPLFWFTKFILVSMQRA